MHRFQEANSTQHRAVRREIWSAVRGFELATLTALSLPALGACSHQSAIFIRFTFFSNLEFEEEQTSFNNESRNECARKVDC